MSVATVRKSSDQLAKMRLAGRVVAEMHECIREAIRPGVTTLDLDTIGREVLDRRGARSNFLHYHGFPAVICTSPNDMIVHGIPGAYALAEGDILSVDVGVTLGGFVADSAWTFPVGEIPDETERLLRTCEAALFAGIEQARPGNRIGDISAAVQALVEEAGFTVVRALVGHGVGRSMHEEPQIPNFGRPGHGPVLQPGMTLAIEPMINVGTADIVIDDDKWSIYTADGSLSAHFEHTVAVTAEGPRVLTLAEAPLLR
jgi:methionyl aminopeptidase